MPVSSAPCPRCGRPRAVLYDRECPHDRAAADAKPCGRCEPGPPVTPRVRKKRKWPGTRRPTYVQLQARIAELESALAPFAAYAAIVWEGAHPGNPIGDACPPVPPWLPGERDRNAKPLPTIGDCRRAAPLLAGGGPVVPTLEVS